MVFRMGFDTFVGKLVLGALLLQGQLCPCPAFADTDSSTGSPDHAHHQSQANSIPADCHDDSSRDDCGMDAEPEPRKSYDQRAGDYAVSAVWTRVSCSSFAVARIPVRALYDPDPGASSPVARHDRMLD